MNSVIYIDGLAVWITLALAFLFLFLLISFFTAYLDETRKNDRLKRRIREIEEDNAKLCDEMYSLMYPDYRDVDAKKTKKEDAAVR